jgi:hypothetical protein
MSTYLRRLQGLDAPTEATYGRWSQCGRWRDQQAVCATSDRGRYVGKLTRIEKVRSYKTVVGHRATGQAGR